MKLNEKIYYYRTHTGLSQEQLAAAVGVSRQAVSKWELGDAVPEVTRLLALARTFGITADELLSETEVPCPALEMESSETGSGKTERRETAASGFETDPRQEVPRTVSFPCESGGSGAASESKEEGAETDWLDRLPGVLRRLVREYGWLAGVYTAVSGLGIAIVGALGLFLFAQMFRVSSDAFDQIGGFGAMGGVRIEGAEGLPPEVLKQIADEIGSDMGGFDGVGVVSDIGRIFQGFAAAILVIGLIILTVGIALAVWLHGRGQTERERK